ncbi:MAG: FAD-dependent thymidylate synthase [Verrucomicrobiota bacterium]
MKVTQVAICPSEASTRAGRPALTPELLAASGARYSRNNEGLESILSKIDPGHLEKSVDSIFRMVDYGHQSIADMVPAAMFMDGISLWLAYYVWSLCPTAGGQESSTRYLKISPDSLVNPEELGIPAPAIVPWHHAMENAFRAYQTTLALWEELARAHPSVTGIPQSLLQDASELGQKKVARMRRNYAFDRARYFLPVASATNVMLIMSARAWVSLCQHLLSHPLPEPQRLGQLIRQELEMVAPRLLKHARGTESHQKANAHEWAKLTRLAATPVADEPAGTPYLEVLTPAGVSPEEVAGDLAFPAQSARRLDRYAAHLRPVWLVSGRFRGIRDLIATARAASCPQVPQGFYGALDQVPRGKSDADRIESALEQAAGKGAKMLQRRHAGGCRTADRATSTGRCSGRPFPSNMSRARTSSFMKRS